MGQKTTVIVALLVMLILTACNRYQVIPKQYQDQVNRNLTFVETKNDPHLYRGQTVVWGGEVLHATRLPDRTKIEVLQLPLTDDLIPAAERAESNGRFLAFDTQGEILDPAVVKEGTRLTIIGQIQGAVSSTSDLGPREYPALQIRDMTVWDTKVSRAMGYPYYGPYYGHYYYGYRPYVFWEGTRVPGS
ncbi:MAG TPA: Slp family lipoprotein [Nitrospiraceae bacterium]|nr:Slp family lipoprotein [Nitrospiraceae bacterium]